MNCLEVIQKRYSVRAYTSDPVEEDKLHQVLEAGRLAPTACNLQPFRVLVIPTAGHQAELSRIYPKPWFSDAPLVLAVCVQSSLGWVRRDGKNYSEVDATIAMDHMILAAASLGLGTCWIAAFHPEATIEVLQLSEDLVPLAFTPLGYPADRPRDKKRKPLEELVLYHRWPVR
jgi:nitroreductase